MRFKVLSGILIIVITTFFISCYTRLDLRTKVNRLSTHNVYKFNNEQLNKTTSRLNSKFRDVIHFYSTDRDLSENYTNIHYWFFGDGSFSHLYALSENRKGKLKVSKEFNIKNPSRLLDYIKVNRIDTVNDTPESGFRNSHLSYIIVEYFNLNDTLISYHLRADSYIKKHGFMDDFGMTPETDSAYKERMNHPKYLLGLKIIGELKMSVNTL